MAGGRTGERLKAAAPALGLLFLCALAVLFATLVSLSEQTRRREAARHHVADLLQVAGLRLERTMSAPLLQARGMVAEIKAHGDVSKSDFDHIAEALLQDHEGAHHFVLTHGTVIDRVYPMAGNEILMGLDYRNLPDQWPLVEQAITQHRAVLQGPIKLVQGGQSVVGRVPVYLPNASGGGRHFFGLVSVVIDIAPYMADLARLGRDNGLDLVLLGRDGLGARGGLIWGDEGVMGRRPVTFTLQLPAGSWQLAGAPRSGWRAYAGPPGPLTWSSWGLAGLFIACLCLLWLYGRHRRRMAAALAVSEDRYRSLFTNARAAMLLLDQEEGLIVDANEAAASYYGYPAAQMRRMRIGDISLDPMRETPVDSRSEHYIRHRLASGEVRTVEAHMGPLPGGGGRLCYAILHDVTERRRLEEELRKLAMAVDQSPASIVITNAAGTIEYVNAAFCRVTGYWPDEAIGQNPAILKSGATTPETYAEMWRRLSSGQPWQGIFQNRRKDGTLYWEQAQIAPILDHQGRITHYLGVKENITERREAEESIRALSQRLQNVLDAASEVAIIACDAEGGITLFNRGAERMLGYSQDEVVGRATPLLFHLPEEVAARAARLTREMGRPVAGFATFVGKAESDGRDVGEWTYRRKDGGTLTVSLVVTPIWDDRRRMVGSLGVAVDITSRKRGEERLRQSEERYRASFEQAGTGIVHADFDGTLLRWNDRFRQILGYAPEDMAQLNFLGLTYEEDRALSREVTEDLRLGRIQSRAFEKRYYRKDGSLTWVKLHCAVSRDADGQARHLITVVEDINDRKQAELQLAETTRRLDEQAQKLRDINQELEQFAYVASHDLRQPLRMVSSYLSLIERRLGKDLTPELEEYLGYAVNGAKHMDALILGLLDYSRTGRRSGDFAPVDLGQTLQDCLLTLAEALEEVGAVVTVAPDLPVVSGDRAELMRLFQNLLGNAVKYRDPERPLLLQVGWRDEGGRVAVWVDDNGTGIDPENHGRVFQIFQRLVPQSACEGYGLGLAICKKIAEHHGGRIWLDSTPGVGSRFLVSLPRAAGSGAQ